METKKMRIGWFMSEKKVKQLGWDAFVSYAREQGHFIEKLDLDGEPKNAPSFDVLLLKMTDELVRKEDPNIQRQVDNARAIVALNPAAVVVDPLENQEKTIDRVSMHHLFQALDQLDESHNLQSAHSRIITSDADLDTLHGVKFPVICKTIQASGALAAHDMSIIWRKEDIKSKFPTYPFFLQEFINHDATIFKIYVMGEDSHIVVRKSLPNFQLEPRDPVDFNSQDWKHGPPAEHARDYAGNYPKPDMEPIKKISKAVSDTLGLTLFGYDIITNIDTKKHAIIDVNYFPDYKGVDNVHARLLEHLITMRNKHATK